MFLKGGCESVYIKSFMVCVDFNSARLSIKFFVKCVLGSVFVDRDFFFSGRILLLFVFLVLHCNLCRASVFSHVPRVDICLKTVMLVSAACVGFVDWYCQTHPRSVCQSDEYLR